MKVLVIGGTKFIGRHLVELLLTDGHEVTIFHRGKTLSPFGRDVAELLGDRQDARSVERLLGGKRFDGVVDVAYDSAGRTGAAEVSYVARALAGARPRYVYTSSVAVYRDTKLDMTEDEPLGGPPQTYAAAKSEAEGALREEEGRGSCSLSVVRPCLVYGRWNPIPRESWLLDRVVAGRPVIVPGDGSTIFQWSYVKDVARALAACLTSERAAGEAFNIAHAEGVSHEEMVRRLATAARRAVEVVHVPRDRIEAAEGESSGTNLYFGQGLDFGESFSVSVEKAKRLLDFRPTDFDLGLRETFEWYIASGPRAAPDLGFERKLLGR